MTTVQPTTLPAWRERLVGHDVSVPIYGASPITPANFDHAASTPALRSVAEAVNHLLEWYSSVHRGAGFLSQVSTAAFEEARAIVGSFVGARPGQHVVIFGANTTWALNKLAHRLACRPGDVIISTELEHHANDLPWRQVAEVVHARADVHGDLDVAHVAQLLERYAGRVRLLAVTGGSNVSGSLPPIHRLAELAHAAGAQIVVDAAQLAAHRPINIGDLADPQHLDYLAISGHKMYAPFGSGALIGRRDTFAAGVPEAVGGGTVRRVATEAVEWADAPARDEAGTPNLVGAVALAAAIRELQQIGMAAIAAHEAALTSRLLGRLAELPRVRIYGQADPARAAERLGVIPFAVEGMDHRLVAAILSCEYGIAVRCGAFCAHPYVARLLGDPAADAACSNGQAGLVRLSLGLASSDDDVDRLIDALEALIQRRYRGSYQLCDDGLYRPQGWHPLPFDAFSLLG
ncbi:MAG TPA: aminotransferase class V-fold PLP-dependent enzyme [Roseiflexaceae bacterium]|nr:aminotransferase class V-fold PLP-dependent enzyme [Roseiflexaceae bacterium]